MITRSDHTRPARPKPTGPVLLAGVMLIGLILTLARPGLADPRLHGRWQEPNPAGKIVATLLVRPDGRFHLDYDGRQGWDVWGRWFIDGQTIILTYTGGLYEDRCRQPGQYTYQVTNDLLLFFPKRDNCPGRRGYLHRRWHRR